eukprot:6486554-Amphidinium_carterae.1
METQTHLVRSLDMPAPSCESHKFCSYLPRGHVPSRRAKVLLSPYAPGGDLHSLTCIAGIAHETAPWGPQN